MALGRIHLDCHGQALVLVDGRMAGEQRRDVDIVAQAQQDQVEARKLALLK